MKVKKILKGAFLIGCVLLKIGFSQDIPVTIEAGHQDILKFLEKAGAGKNAKVIFELNSNLYCLQISEDTLTINNLPNTQNAVLPVISPDGKFYTFALGVSGDGEETVRCSTFINSFDTLLLGKPVQVASQSYVPRFIQNSTTPTILYSTCSSNPVASKHAWDGCGAVVKKTFDPATKLFSKTDTVWESGSYFGGLSYDNKYLCTGWLGTGIALMLDRSSESNKPVCVHLNVKNSVTLKDSLVPFQVCNPSISSSRIFTDAMMFFDVGSDRIPSGYFEPVYKNWGQHEIFFISRFNQKIQKGFKICMEPELSTSQYDTLTASGAKGQSFGTEWNFPEWSNHPYLAVASVKIKRAWNDGKVNPGFKLLEKNEYVSLVNLRDSTFLPILKLTEITKGTGFQWPWLWAEIPSGFSEDSKWLDRTLDIKRFGHKKSINSWQNTLSGNENLQVFNPQGRLVFTGKVSTLNYSLKQTTIMSSGIYMIIIKDNHNKVLHRQIINTQ